MADRIAFNSFLKSFTPNVYFQPPTNISMVYPAIVYTRRGIDKTIANDKLYKLDRSYDVVVIDKNPDSPIAEQLLALDFTSFDRQFITDGLNHISFIIYY